METVSVPSSTFCLTSRVANGDICFLDKRRLELKNVNIFKMEKYISKRKRQFFFILKGLSNKHKLFFTPYALSNVLRTKRGKVL